MTEKSNDAKNAFSRAMGPTVAERKRVSKQQERALPYMSKFSMLFDSEDAILLDQLALTIRRQLGKPVKKSDLLRSLIALTADDPTIRNQLAEELRLKKLDK